MAGVRPFVLDNFSLASFIRSGHPAGTDFLTRIRAREFDVLIGFDPDTRWTPQGGAPVVLSDHYVAVDALGRRTILTPRTNGR